MNHQGTKAPRKAVKPVVDLIEVIQDGGGLPDVDLRSAAACDWQRILMDAHSDLTRELCYYHERPASQTQRVNRALAKMEFICREWRRKGRKE